MDTIIAELSEITGNSGCQTNTSGEAGKENNQCQHNLTAEAHVVGADFAEQGCTVRDDTKNVNAQSAGVSQCYIDDSEEEGGNQASVGAELSQHSFVGNALSFNSLDGDGAEQDCCQQVHRVIALLEAAEERGSSKFRVRHLQAACGIYKNANHENSKAD